MKLLIDVGNTTINFGALENDEVKFLFRFFTKDLSVKKLENHLKTGLNFSSVYISSVVPSTHKIFDKYFQESFNITPTYIKVGDYPNLDIEIDDPHELGVDLYCDVIGALEIYKKTNTPIIIVDLGTATKLLVVNSTNKFSSCVILPGIALNKYALSHSTELLPLTGNEEIKKLSATRNTVEVINSSVYYAHVEMINGLIKRLEKELKIKSIHLVTGGNALTIFHEISEKKILDLNLLFKGMKEIIKYKGV